MGILTFLIVLIVVVVLFSVQNASPVAVAFLFWRFDASLAIIIFLSLVVGIVIGAVIVFWVRRRHGPGRAATTEVLRQKTDASETQESQGRKE